MNESPYQIDKNTKDELYLFGLYNIEGIRMI